MEEKMKKLVLMIVLIIVVAGVGYFFLGGFSGSFLRMINPQPGLTTIPTVTATTPQPSPTGNGGWEDDAELQSLINVLRTKEDIITQQEQKITEIQQTAASLQKVVDDQAKEIEGLKSGATPTLTKTITLVSSSPTVTTKTITASSALATATITATKSVTVTPAISPTSTLQAPQVIRKASQSELMEVLRAYFPNAKIRGAERTQYDMVSSIDVQKFLVADRGSELPLGEDSDYAIGLVGAFKQPGWSAIPVGFAKKDLSQPVFFLVVAQEDGKFKLFTVDNSSSDELIPLEIDGSVEFMAVLY